MNLGGIRVVIEEEAEILLPSGKSIILPIEYEVEEEEIPWVSLTRDSDYKRYLESRINPKEEGIRPTKVSKFRNLWKRWFLKTEPRWLKPDVFTSILVDGAGDIIDVRYMSESKRYSVYGGPIGVFSL